jgi:exosome complex component RRP40
LIDVRLLFLVQSAIANVARPIMEVKSVSWDEVKNSKPPFPKKIPSQMQGSNRTHRDISGQYFNLTPSPLSNKATSNINMATLLLPGEEIPPDQLPKSKKGTLTLGPGLRHIPPTTILTTTSGSLHIDNKKSALWLEHPHGRYQPSVGDLVVAQIHHSSTDTYHCVLTPHTPFALLGQLSFEGANKKTRPKLEASDLVYARVCRASKGEDVEVECCNSATGKAEGMGPLKGGMVFEVHPAFARRLMLGAGKGGVVLLEEVGEKVRFEVAVGRNGRVWVDSGSVKATVAIGRLLAEVDEQGLGVEEQKKLVRRVLREV